MLLTGENFTEESKEGFVFSMQTRLMQRALAAWPRRGNPLLEINCGEGNFLPFLWQSGFDIVATDLDPNNRGKAQALSIPGLEIYAASDDDLPFDDDSFDWVIWHVRHCELAYIDKCTLEALRVARRGLMFTFWNKASLPAILASKKNMRFVHAPSWLVLWRKLGNLYPGRIKAFATLCCPEWTWGKGKITTFINNLLPWLPFGAWCIIRIDLAPLYPVTPLPLQIQRNISKNEPAFEFVHKNLKTNKSHNGT